MMFAIVLDPVLWVLRKRMWFSGEHLNRAERAEVLSVDIEFALAVMILDLSRME